jgi:hypothetical protein
VDINAAKKAPALIVSRVAPQSIRDWEGKLEQQPTQDTKRISLTPSKKIEMPARGISIIFD